MPDIIEPPYAPVTPTPARTTCRLHRPGHTPHHIQVRLAGESPPDAWSAAVVMAIEADVVTVAADDGELVRLRTHDAARLAALVRRHGAAVSWNRRHATLHLAVDAALTRAVFSVQPADEPPTSCEGWS